MNEGNMVQEKCEIFYKQKLPVHIVKNNGGWYNGDIKDIGSSFIILEEYKLGSMVVFFSEIVKIDSFTKEIKKEGKDGTVG